jgi:hypothetical protein
MRPDRMPFKNTRMIKIIVWGAFATEDDLQSQDIFVKGNGYFHVRNPNGNRGSFLNDR